MAKAKLIPPYGGKLINLMVEGREREELLARAGQLPSIKITMRNMCDLELIATGGLYAQLYETQFRGEKV